MRWIFRVIGAFVVLLFLALGVFLLIPAERIAEVASDRITQATGRSVTITGEARPTLWPDLGIVIEGLRVGNPAWAGDAPMIEADRVNVGVAWDGLFSGDIRVERAVLEGAQIMLVRAEDGRSSWDMGGSGESTGGQVQIGFDEAIIRNARVRYLDRAAGADWDIAQMDATVRLPEAGGVVALEGNAQVNGVPLVLDTTIDGVADLLAGEARPLNLTLRWQGGSLAFDGQLGLDATAQGAMELNAEDLAPLVALAGGAMPELPLGLGRDRIAVTGDVRLAQEGSVHLRDGTVRLDETVLSVAADLVPGEDRPMLRGTITGGEIALPGLLETDAETSGTGEGWPRDIIDVSGLFAADADLTVRAQSLDLGAVALSEIDLRATINRGRLVFDIASIRTYEGQLAGQFVINGRGGLSVGGDLILANVALQPLLTAMAGYERLQGTGSASLEFLGVGNDLYTIMDGLEAEGDLALGQGAILGLDLGGMLRNFDPSFEGEGQRTVYDRVTADFIVRDGIVQNEDLFLDAPWGEMRGAGEADLAAMTVDYTLIPGLLRNADGSASVRVPIAVTGPWSAPQIGPDLALLAEIELAEEAARLEEEARATLEAEEDRLEELARDRANEVLGTDIQAGDTPEQIEQQLTDELISGVQQLIFGNGGESE